MPDPRGVRRSLIVLGILCVAAFGCEEEPQIHESDQPAAAGDMQFEMTDYQLRYLELTDEDGQTIEYPDPVLAVYVEMTNVGEDDFQYTPQHDARELAESQHFLLYDAPDQTEEVDWETFSPEALPGVELREGGWEQQKQDAVTLGPDESIEDVMLFEPPESDSQSLLLSIPPTVHRGEVPTFIRFDYERPEPEGRTMHEVGDTIEFNGVTFEITDITQEYIELEEDDEEGFSSDPVLKVSYTLTNDGDDPIEFDPQHDDVTGSEGPVLQAGEIDFSRARFPGDTTPVDQLGTTEIEPGESVDDFAIFDRPDESADAVTFVMPANYFEQSGTVRVSFSYDPEDVEEPEELQE